MVGPTNSFAHTAARMVAEAPASRWNPLFIHGGVGLGKTHLLHAIGHEIHRQHPDWRVTFATGERFVTEFIGSLMNQKRASSGSSMEEFRERYRTAPDVLLVDDIQFLSNKDSSQDEFFHTFNALHYAHKQIVLASDKLPSELPGVEDRLRSRFTWGLIAEVVGGSPPRGDKALSSAEARELLAGVVTVEEKPRRRCTQEYRSGRWPASRRTAAVAPASTLQRAVLSGGWLAGHEALLAPALKQGLILFGEWCAARHSIVYDRLPDWFMAFDVFDQAAGRFWASARRDAWRRTWGSGPSLLGARSYEPRLS